MSKQITITLPEPDRFSGWDMDVVEWSVPELDVQVADGREIHLGLTLEPMDRSETRVTVSRQISTAQARHFGLALLAAAHAVEETKEQSNEQY